MAINIIISFNNRTTNENNRKDNFSSALIFNFFCLLFAQFKRANRLRVNIKSSPLSKISISQVRQLLFCRTIVRSSQSIYTQNFKEYSSLLLTCWWPGRDWGWERTWPAWSTCTAETITSIWCFIRSWCNLLIFFFFNTRNNLKNKKEKRDRDLISRNRTNREETLTNNYLLYSIPKKKKKEF